MTILCYGAFNYDLHQMKIKPRTIGGSIKKIVCGTNHILLLTQKNTVLASGDNTYFQCGNGTSEIQNYFMKLHLPNLTILDIAAGSYHSLVLGSRDGINYVYAFGHDAACGIVDNLHTHEIKQKQMLPDNIVSIYAGQMKSVALTKMGEVYIWGLWEDSKKRIKPKRLHF